MFHTHPCSLTALGEAVRCKGRHGRGQTAASRPRHACSLRHRSRPAGASPACSPPLPGYPCSQLRRRLRCLLLRQERQREQPGAGDTAARLLNALLHAQRCHVPWVLPGSLSLGSLAAACLSPPAAAYLSPGCLPLDRRRRPCPLCTLHCRCCHCSFPPLASPPTRRLPPLPLPCSLCHRVRVRGLTRRPPCEAHATRV